VGGQIGMVGGLHKARHRILYVSEELS
jgi:hypothetical protein